MQAFAFHAPPNDDACDPEVAFAGGFAVRADATCLVVASLVDGEVCDRVPARWGEVSAVALAPGGERVAIVADGQVRTLTVGGREDRALTAFHPRESFYPMFGVGRTAIAWDDDGVVVAGNAGVIRWADDDGRVTNIVPGPASALCAVAVGRPDGRIACGGVPSMGWGQPPERPRTDASVVAIGFPDDHTVVVAHSDGTIRTWNTTTHRCERMIRVLGVPCAVDRIGRYVVSVLGGTVQVHASNSGEVLGRVVSAVPMQARIAIDGDRVAVCERRRRLVVAGTGGTTLFELRGDLDGPVAIEGQSGRLAWADRDAVHVKTLADGREVAHEVPNVNVLAFAPDGSWLACGGTSGVSVLRIADGACRTFAEITCCASQIAVSRDGRVARAQSHEDWVWVLDPLRNEARALYGHRGHTTAVAWSPDGATLASGGVDGAVCLFDPVSGVRHAILGVLPDGTTAAW